MAQNFEDDAFLDDNGSMDDNGAAPAGGQDNFKVGAGHHHQANSCCTQSGPMQAAWPHAIGLSQCMHATSACHWRGLVRRRAGGLSCRMQRLSP